MPAAISDALLAYAHYLAVFGVFATLSMEAVLLRPTLIGESGRWIYRVDIAYFVCAILAVASGLGRALFGSKGWGFYAHNPVFYTKIGLFALIGLISIAPTRRFIRWSREFRINPAYAVSMDDLKRARRSVMIEVHLLTLLPLLAALMARGIGL
jgi:putative membrane protein